MRIIHVLEFTASCDTESVELVVKNAEVVPEFPSVTAIALVSLAAAVATDRLRHKSQQLSRYCLLAFKS